tara:strand:+ start:439 stop:777 length:339 start_codon:yes stop_codon:yes gene_type:complete
MSIIRKRSGSLPAHSSVKHKSNSILIVHDTVVDVADAVFQCCDVEDVNHVCNLVYKDISSCRVFGSVSAQNSTAYSSSVHASVANANEIGGILQKPFSKCSDYQNSDIAQVI